MLPCKGAARFPYLGQIRRQWAGIIEVKVRLMRIGQHIILVEIISRKLLNGPNGAVGLFLIGLKLNGSLLLGTIKSHDNSRFPTSLFLPRGIIAKAECLRTQDPAHHPL